MLELARTLFPEYRSVFFSFRESGLCHALLEKARQHGCLARALKYDTPRLLASWREVARSLRETGASLLCCHGYKANLIGLLAARRVGIPVVSVSRGWTGESYRVRLYESLDRRVLRAVDTVVCVSKAQATKVRQAGVPSHKTTVISNAVRMDRFAEPQAIYRGRLQRLFPEPRRLIVGAAGRLSPEKGFSVLVDAAKEVICSDSSVGFVLFGDGALRDSLVAQIEGHGLENHLVLAGFCAHLDQYIPHFDVLVLPSFTEGLPNVALEASASGVPIVATAVGGTPEIVEDGVNGYLVPPGAVEPLANRVKGMLQNEDSRQRMGLRGQDKVSQRFTFSIQADQYRKLFLALTRR